MTGSARAAAALLATVLVFGVHAGIFVAIAAFGAHLYFSRVEPAPPLEPTPLQTEDEHASREIVVHGNVGSTRRVLAREAIALGEPAFVRQPVAAWMAKLHCTETRGMSVELAVQAACYHATAAAERTGSDMVIIERDFLSSLVFAWESEALVQMMAMIARGNSLHLPCAVLYADTPADECAAIVRDRACTSGNDMAIPRLGELERCHNILMEFYERSGIPVVRLSKCVSYKDALTTATNEALETGPLLTEACVWEIATACKVQGLLDPM